MHGPDLSSQGAGTALLSLYAHCRAGDIHSVTDLPESGPNKGPPAQCPSSQRMRPSLVPKQRKALLSDERRERCALRLHSACSPHRPWAGLLYRDLVRREGAAAVLLTLQTQASRHARSITSRAQRLCTRPAAAILNRSVVCGYCTPSVS